ncbi:hypothetical protein GBAR_LOCUS10601 [Geodia barretti]|uniref:Uncharacterized protein n=1 Tax=Geodia barretti TaxID=519541 RepID=A0AA35RTK1_GEOBA|nr:hypothetical protein GBAR_LOCUS10601 [Geodia barretti]
MCQPRNPNELLLAAEYSAGFVEISSAYTLQWFVPFFWDLEMPATTHRYTPFWVVCILRMIKYSSDGPI